VRALQGFVVLLAPLAASAPGEGAPAFFNSTQSVQDTVKVPQREDHSPFLTRSASGNAALVWVATAPDTNPSGRFDELAYAERGPLGWDTPEILAGPSTIFTPEVVFDAQGGRWISWAQHDGIDSQIRLRRDLGMTTWNFTFGDAGQPDIEPSLCADDSGGVVVVWQGWRTDNYEILFVQGNHDGFSAPLVISESPLSDREPEVVWGNGQAWMVWSSYRNPAYNLISRRLNGQVLSAPVRLTTSSRSRNLHPQIAWDDVNDVLWVAFIKVNQGWPGINQHEFPALYDVGSPRIRAFNGGTIFRPAGLNEHEQYPLAPMEDLGYSRYDFGGTLLPDRYGEGVAVVPLPGRRVEVFHRQIGSIVEFGSPNFYWSVSGTRYAGGAWSAPSEFLEPRSSFAWEEPAAVVAGDSLWVAWSADTRSPAIAPGVNQPNLFGHDANIVVRGDAADTTTAGPPGLVIIGAASAPPAVSAPPRPQFTIDDHGTPRTLLWGDNHRHSVDVSWDAYVDPAIKQQMFYSLDWLGFDWICPSDHAERFSKAIWAFVPRSSMIYDVPARLRVFPGYERAMRSGAGGGDQNAMYRDLDEFSEASAFFPEDDSWLNLYAAQGGVDVLSVPNQSAQCFVITKWHELDVADSLRKPLRLVEVYQAARGSFEYQGCPGQTTFCTVSPDSGWVKVALALGMRIGILAASDHGILVGYTGVFAESNSRDDIWQALRDRHCFGTSMNGRMNIDFRVAGEIMGSEVSTYLAPTISMYADADTSALQFLEVNKDGNPAWFTASSASPETTITFTDPDPVVPGTSSYYYLRTRDAAGHITWTSPVWVDFVEPPTGADHDSGETAAGGFTIRATPNPSRSRVRFDLSGLSPIGGVLRLHDSHGRLVRELRLPPGVAARSVDWDGRDSSGHRVAAGVYYAVAQSGGVTRSTKLVLVQ
jgi:hypothetical protein